MEWVCREIVKGVANSAVEVATSIEAAANLDEWTESGPVSTRTAKKKRFLHRMLGKMDS